MSQENQKQECSQCGRPGMYNVEGHLLCLSCYAKVQEIATRRQEMQQEQLRNLMALYNNAAAQFDFAAGIPGFTPRMQIPDPTIRTIQQGPMTFNHFDISESKIGVINTGEVQRIDVAMELIEQGGSADLATAIQEFTQTVINSDKLSTLSKNELLEQVAEVSEQIALPPEKQKRGIIKALLDGIKNTASTVTAVADAWLKLQPLLEGIFRIGT